MKKFLIWFFCILLAITASAAWVAYDRYNVRSLDEAKALAVELWQKYVQKVEPAQPKKTINLGPALEPVVQEPAKPTKPKKDTLEAHHVGAPEETTNKFSIFSAAEGEEFNPLLLGHWTCLERPTWHRVYTDEYSGNGYYWGKEWDEAEDVTEEDLVDYGNGWFEWKQDENDILELATTDMSDARVPFIYTIRKLTDKDLIYIEQRSQAKRTFIKKD